MSPTPPITLLPDLLTPDEAQDALRDILASSPLQERQVWLYGRWHTSPRRTAWHGDPGCTYTYSRATWEPTPWTPILATLRQRVEAAAEAPFNCVLVNHYRSGQDSMGWHADDEPVFGPRPTIASLSLGGVRRFVMKHRATGARCAWELPSGSLLIMRDDAQEAWVHALPRTARPVPPRVNLTWRRYLLSESA